MIGAKGAGDPTGKSVCGVAINELVAKLEHAGNGAAASELIHCYASSSDLS